MNFLKNFFLLIITILFISNFNFSNEKNYFLSNKIKRVNDALTEENIENRKQTTIKLKKNKISNNDSFDISYTYLNDIKDFSLKNYGMEIKEYNSSNNSINLKLLPKEKMSKIEISTNLIDGTEVICYAFSYEMFDYHYISTTSEDDAWYLASKNCYDNNLLTEEEIYENYEKFSRRDLLEDTNVFYNTNNLTTQSSNDNALKQTIYKGKIMWKTKNGHSITLKNAKVNLYDKELIGKHFIKTTYTDENGEFVFTFNNADEWWQFENGGYDPFVCIYPESTTFKVSRDWFFSGLTYYYIASNPIYNVKTGSTTTFEATILYEENNLANNAFYLSQALVNAQNFAIDICGMEANKVLNVAYPGNIDKAFCYDVFSGFPKDSFNKWDTIMHEYGHYVEGVVGIYGPNLLDIILNDPNHNSSLCNMNTHENKQYALELTWSEAWATTFAFIAQDYYKTDERYGIGKIEFFGDLILDDNNTIDFSNYTPHPTESCECQEDAVISYLWDLYDKYNKNFGDNIGIGHNIFWKVSTIKETYTLIDFIKNFEKNFSRFFDKNNKILENKSISPSGLKLLNSPTNSIPPTFMWYPNGCVHFPNNKFSLVFYDLIDGEKYIIENIISENYNSQSFSYTLSSYQWNQIRLMFNGKSNIKVAVRGYQTSNNLVTGPYTSQYLGIEMPIKEIIYNSNLRICEEIISINSGDIAEFYVKYNISGYKVMQTLGALDTCMDLFDQNGKLIKSNDDGGYALNSFILENLSANIKYKIRLSFFNSTTQGNFKLLLTNSFYDKKFDADSMSSYSNIFNINNENYSWYTYVAQHHSHLVTFTPPNSGTYIIETEALFDSYLYVIDPRLASSLIANIDYNDDISSNNRNARVTKKLDANVSYLIIYTKYNPSTEFTDLDKGDDLVLKIRKS